MCCVCPSATCLRFWFNVHYRARLLETLNNLCISVILLVFELNISPFAKKVMHKISWTLASQSPRRAQLLTEAGVTFEAIKPPYDDPPQPEDTGATPEQIAMQLSLQKALSVKNIHPQNHILAADTLIVMPDGSLAGTPVTRDEARQQITDMLNCAHWVVTGVTMIIPGQNDPVQLADRAQVTLGNLPESEINAYLDTQQWQGKAGGYNLFDRQKAGWPVTVEGDETTVVGLPMRLLKDFLTGQ